MRTGWIGLGLVLLGVAARAIKKTKDISWILLGVGTGMMMGGF